MTFFSQFRIQAACLMLLALLGACACNGTTGVPGDESSAPADQHQAPFHDEASTSVTPASTKLLRASDQSARPDKLPFQEANLPAGTLVTVTECGPGAAAAAPWVGWCAQAPSRAASVSSGKVRSLMVRLAIKIQILKPLSG